MRSPGPACLGCGCRYAGRVAQEAEDFGVQPLGDLGGRGVTVGRDRAGDGVVGHLGSAGQLLDEDGDRGVEAGGGQVAGHLPHGHRVADQADQAAPRLVGLWVEGQYGVTVELQEPDQASAALRLADRLAELLVGGTSRQLSEQRTDVWLADAVVDAVRDDLKRPFAGEYVATRRLCRALVRMPPVSPLSSLFLSPCSPGRGAGTQKGRGLKRL